MTKKLASMLYRAAGVSLTLLPVLAFASHSQPAAEPITQPDVSAAFAQMAGHDALATGWAMRVLYLLAGIVVGGLAGAFFSHRLQRFRRRLIFAMVVLTLFASVFINDLLAFCVGTAVAGLAAYWLLRAKPSGFDPIFGNARPATRNDIAQAGHMAAFDPASQSYKGGNGIPLGNFVEATT